MRIRLVFGTCFIAWQVVCAHAQAADAPDLRPDLRLAHTWDDPEVRKTWQALGGESAAADALSPAEAFAAALTFSPQMTLLRARVDVGRAGVLLARQRVNPVLSLTPEKVINAALGVSPWVAAISLVWPVHTNGKRSLAIEQALATSDATLLGAANEIWMLRASVRTSLCATEMANARLALAREELALRDDLTTRLAKRADAGVASTYEVTRARLERERAALAVLRGESSVLSSKRELAAATGLPFAEVERRTIGTSCLDARPGTGDAVSDAVTGAVAARLDLRVKMAEFRVADAAWRKEVAKRMPDLNLGPGYTYDQGDRKISFTISGELPIYARNEAGIASAAAERSRVIAEVEILQYSVLDTVDRARDRLRAAELALEQSEQAVSQAQGLAERDVERRNVGELDQSAVVASRLAVVLSRSDVLLAQQELSDAVTFFEAATQAPLVAPLFDGSAAQSLLASQAAKPGDPP